jgi:hypothetical protein
VDRVAVVASGDAARAHRAQPRAAVGDDGEVKASLDFHCGLDALRQPPHPGRDACVLAAAVLQSRSAEASAFDPASLRSSIGEIVVRVARGLGAAPETDRPAGFRVRHSPGRERRNDLLKRT